MPEGTSARIARLYGQVLDVDRVSGDDDFFVLGGNSLTAMELLDAIDAELGIRLPPRVLYRATAVADLAREVDALLARPDQGA
ncbi:phosphopantetheine-binding protein [Kitasatospora sp. NPDC059673]|uniref:phosphopantetheine-binding protein n=1 Tax=Kitasatospora sp. NPDC059673 TaxID=3346901 RepID=UPI0036823128